MTFTLFNALNALYPTALWTMVGDVYSGLEWLDPQIDKPTQAELEAKVASLQAEWDAAQYQRARASEYPPIEDYVDGIVKGDALQVQNYIDACLAVKAKHPKPE